MGSRSLQPHTNRLGALADLEVRAPALGAGLGVVLAGGPNSSAPLALQRLAITCFPHLTAAFRAGFGVRIETGEPREGTNRTGNDLKELRHARLCGMG